MEKEDITLKTGEEVDLIITEKTDIGYNAVINNLFTGVIYENQVFKNLNQGQKVKGYVQKIRDDNQVDLVDYNIFSSYWLEYCPDNWPSW